MSGENSDNRRIDRRNVLRGIGVAGGVTSGLSMMGGVTAKKADVDVEEIAEQVEKTKKKRQSLRAKYESPGQVRATLRRNAGDLIAELVRQGFLDDAGLDSLPIENVNSEVTLLKPGDSFEGVGVTARLGSDVETAVVLVSKHMPTHHVAIYVQPEAGKSYSYVTPKNGGEATHLNETDESVDVGTMEEGCYTYTNCADSACDFNEGPLCVTSYFREETYECCPYGGCQFVGDSGCKQGCSCCNGC